MMKLKGDPVLAQQIAQRNSQIPKIVEQVKELGEIYKHMSNLVIEQGTILDRIDFNIQQAQTQSKQAVVELTKTHEAYTST
jgi:syntaxin 16